MIDGGAVTLDLPRKRISGDAGGNRDAITDSGLDLAAFLVVVPRNQLQRGELFSRVVQPVHRGECVQPGLSALLSHYPV